MNQHWDTTTYDSSMSFVSQFGKSLIELLQPRPGERILDWGSGSGDLAVQIARSGALVTGIDASEEMIHAAKTKYPELEFILADGQSYVAQHPVDAVFSNAALHWLLDAESTVASIAASLRRGGRFVAEFGALGNIASIVDSLPRAFQAAGLSKKPQIPWYFPSIGQYTTLLEQHGFTVDLAHCFDRPTPLEGGEQGLRLWIDIFANGIVSVLSPSEREAVFNHLEADLSPVLFQDGRWVLDYRRMRVIAIKR